MMQIELIEGMIANKLELSGMRNEGGEGQCRSLLYHLFTAVEIFRLMVPQEKETVAEWYQLFAKDFRVNLFLKELKSKKNKEKTAPAPHRKEKNKKEKVQKNIYIAGREDFHQECLGYVGMYDEQRLADFYNYWSEVNEKTGKMRFKEQRYWNTERRLKRWMNTSYSADNTAAAIRLKRTRKKQEPEQAVAAKRNEDNERLEQEIEARKQGAVSYEEWLKIKKLKD